jgi:DNA-binding MurR/RpiR family transcriptional regulator
VIAISQSGNSGHIVRAVDAGRPRDIRTITLSAMRADNRCRAAGDLNFYVPLARYGLAQSAHQVILDYWFDQIWITTARAPCDRSSVLTAWFAA